ncbi:MAG: phosphatase PAP2 family protein, partial [Gammaproteobacteria bacterium]|nr:phosphatase PAP2 family protein [Gammaproteobacteria bacterium]
GGIYLTKDFSYVALILKTIGMTSFLCLLLYIGNTAIFTTPFTTLHDSFINQSDLFIGFHLPPLLQWISHHPESDKVSWGIYFSLLFSAIFLPTALAIAKQQKAAYHYYFSFIISVVIAYAIYYLFPTTSPAAVYSHYYFNYAQGHLENYFQLEHNHQNYFFDMSSVVGFPSLHAAWITLIVCFLYPYRIVKYFALIYGISVIIAILFTGWHFFTDILGGIAIGILSIQLSKRFMRNHLKP